MSILRLAFPATSATRRVGRWPVPAAIFVWTLWGCAPAPATQVRGEDFAEARAAMVRDQLKARDIVAKDVLEAMGKVPRHEFVPGAARAFAYQDSPLPIGAGQTISQPYIVALMTQVLAPEEGERILEIGTGSGYQAAVLAELEARVYTIEIVPELARRARAALTKVGYTNVELKTGNGYLGWPEHAPFDAVIVTAAPEELPSALVEQLRVGGRLIAPIGPVGGVQTLKLYRKTSDGLEEEDLIPVRFVPMVKEP